MIDLGEELRGDSAIVAPCVCRTSPGSHTTIVVAIDNGRIRHIPMDSEGLRIIVSRYDSFLEEYVRTAYSPVEAAKKYLDAKHIQCDPIARSALEQLIDPHKENDMNETTATETSKAARVSDLAKKRSAKAQAIADSAAKHKAKSDAKKAAKKTAKADKPKAKSNGSGRGLGIGAFCKEQILAGVEAEKIVEVAQRKFPGCKVNGAHISWYRGRLREEGKLK